MKKFLLNLGIVILAAFILALSLRGLGGNPTASQLNSSYWQEVGPFELSPERGRFALTYSIVENHSFQFSNQIGQFAKPDVATLNGHYLSLFPPGVSFVLIPGYILGKYFGASQVGTFGVIAFFAVLNFMLIRAISKKLGASNLAANLGALVYLFATPAFTYSVDLYEHQISTFLILLSVYLLEMFDSFWSLAGVFFLCAASVPVDNPNLFLMLPIGLYSLGRIFKLVNDKREVKIDVNLIRLISPLAIILPMLFFLWFNKVSNGNPFQLSGTLPQSPASVVSTNSKIDLKNNVALQTVGQDASNKKSAVGFFQTRNLLNGFYIHFISDERGIIFYTPVILFGILGFLLALKKKIKLVPLLLSIIGVNVLLYSMWGDPWGGWAFGSRYLIPAYAILAIFVSLLLTYWRKYLVFLILFSLSFIYSVSVNTLGAITSSAIPPKGEAQALEKITQSQQKYTFVRDWDFLKINGSKSFVFQSLLRGKITSTEYFEFLVALISLSGLSLTTFLYLVKEENA